MKRASFAFFLLLFAAATPWADIRNRPREAIEGAVRPHGDDGARYQCSVVYYDLCSGWLWSFSGWQAGDEAGVVFDLPQDCGAPPDWGPTNTHFWWYWRFTAPGRGFTVSYHLRAVDASMCPAGAPGGSITGYDPVEQWNYHSGLGGIGTVGSGRAAITATWDTGALPRFCTDHANRNYAAPVACPGYAVGAMHTFYWGGTTTQYCPPLYFRVNGYLVQCLMDAGWDIFADPDATQPSSWSSVKSLFR